MMTVHAFIAGAVLCFDGQCYPALMGRDTPVGQFTLRHEYTSIPGYQGDVLLFKETDTARWAIHRTWPGRENLYTEKPAKRRAITDGCINVPPPIYDALVMAHAIKHASVLRIHPGRPGPSMFERNTARMAMSVRSPLARW